MSIRGKRTATCQKTETPGSSATTWSLEYFTEYLTESSFHGVRFFAYGRTRTFEVLFWVLTWMLAVYAAIYGITSTWGRYQSSPTVISMDRNFMDFSTTIPAITICLHGLLNKTRARIFVDKKWVNATSEKKSYYLDFLQTIANVSYENLENFDKFANDNSIPRDGYYHILQEISLDFPGHVDTKEHVQKSMTDRGMCYSVNAALRSDLHDRRKGKRSWDSLVLRDTAKLKYENGKEASITVSNLETSSTIYPHSPMEMSEVTDASEHVLPRHIHEATYKVTEVVAGPGVANLAVEQRHCRFPNESNLVTSPLYSYTHCRMECRMQLAVELCGCSPYFYPLIDGFTECTIEGLLCLSKHRDSIKYLINRVTGKEIRPCKCIATCELVSYTLEKKAAAFWSEGSQFTLHILQIPRMQLKRNVLYGPMELLASFGGTLGFFLGCSLLSVAEVIYFFTLRLGRQLLKHLRK